MRSARILFKDEEAGILTENDDGSCTFVYHDSWLSNNRNAPISLTLPKTDHVYTSKSLFSFFYNMLPEGSNKHFVCNQFKIDKDDAFGLLLITAKTDTIGAVRVVEIDKT